MPRVSSVLRPSERRAILLLGELAISALALALANASRDWWDATPAAITWWFVSLLAIEVFVAHASDADDLRKAANPFSGAYASVRSWLVTAGLYLMLPYFSAPLLWSRRSALIFVATGIVLRLLWRSAYAVLVRQPRFLTRFAIVGTGAAATTIAEAIQTHLGPGHLVLGCIAEEPVKDEVAEAEAIDQTLPILGGAAALEALLQSGGVSTLILTRGAMPAELYAAVLGAYEAGIRVVPMPVFFESVTGRVPTEHVGDYWYVSLPKMEQDWTYGLCKRAVDVVGALLGLAVTALLFPLIALAIVVSGRGPVLYSQTRLGLRGRPFRVWKFRSMVANAEADGVPQWAQTKDARVTPVGRFLRASHMDELPQFWNVLCGQMSLVGPRPERPEFVDLLQDQIPFYRLRLLTRPGITGWAQVKQRYANSVSDTLRKLEYDLYYVNHQSLYLDLLILVKTLSAVVRLRGV